MSVNKKYEDYVEIYRTPIIMLTNNEVLNHDTVWTDRCFFYKWKRLDLWQDNVAKPHPFVWRELVNKYVFKYVFLGFSTGRKL